MLATLFSKHHLKREREVLIFSAIDTNEYYEMEKSESKLNVDEFVIKSKYLAKQKVYFLK